VITGSPDTPGGRGGGAEERTKEPAVQLRGLRKTYAGARRRPARVALDGLDLRIERGERVALLGANGSGKSTVLTILSRTIAADGGEAKALGFDLRDARAGGGSARGYLAGLGVVFQHAALDGLLSVRENLRTHAALLGWSRARADERIAALARVMGFADRLDDRVGTLSGGLARRADLGRALMSRPRLLLLDEPTAGLDPAARAEFLDVLFGMGMGAGEAVAGAEGPTVLLSTHLMDEAERADRVVMLAAGRVVADGTPASLRAAVGGMVLRVGGLAADEAGDAALARLGWSRVVDASSRRFRAGPGADVGEATRLLVASGAAVEVGPPTLEDAYHVHTGTSLRAGRGAEGET